MPFILDHLRGAQLADLQPQRPLAPGGQVQQVRLFGQALLRPGGGEVRPGGEALQTERGGIGGERHDRVSAVPAILNRQFALPAWLVVAGERALLALDPLSEAAEQ